MRGLARRTPDISVSSKGPIVNLVGWIAMVTMCLSVFTVLISKYLVLRKLVWNDVRAPRIASSKGRLLARSHAMPTLTASELAPSIVPELQRASKTCR